MEMRRQEVQRGAHCFQPTHHTDNFVCGDGSNFVLLSITAELQRARLISQAPRIPKINCIQ